MNFNHFASTMWMSLALAGAFLIGLAESQYTCRFSDELGIDKGGNTFLQHYVNRDEGTITMRIRYTGGQSWIGIGINRNGKGKMTPGYAIIGDASRGVKRYNLASDDKSGSGVIPIDDVHGHLKSSSFTQNGGESILEFTHDLAILNPDDGSTLLEISDASVWIWAVGLPNNQWEGKHKVHGAFDGLSLGNGCIKDDVAEPPTLKPTSPPVPEPASPPVPPPTKEDKNDGIYPESQYTCRFSDELGIDKGGNTFLQHYVNRDEGTITMRIRYTGGQSWIGIGINRNGKGKMTPGYAIIGDASRGVKRYNLASDDKSGSGVIPIDDIHGHLKSSSFTQNGGESILEFTHDLAILNPDDGSTLLEISDASVWIWAVGLPNNQWEGKHKVHGAFDGLSLANGCIKGAVTEPTTLKPTSPPVPEPASPPVPPPTKEDKNDGSASEDESNSEDMSNTGLLGSVTELQGDPTKSAAQGVSFFASESEATRTLWVAHGMLMGIAWGILAPLAIGAAYLRNKFVFLKDNARWLTVHFILCALVALLTVLGSVTAFMAVQQEGDEHFDDDPHQIIGLSIIVLVLVQVIAGYFRPSPVPSPSVKDITPKPFPTRNQSNVDVEGDCDVAIDEDTTYVDNNVQISTTKAFYVRKVWEYTHRSLGVIMLGLSWYNCHSGIVLHAEEYEQDGEAFWLTVFWAVTGCIGGAILFAGFFSKSK